MNGYIKSRRSAGVYCMKRHINPGQMVSLDELYEQYGVSHNISPGPEFVKWLRTVKLQRRDIWEIVYDGMSITTGDEPYEALRKAEEERKAVEAVKQEAIKAEKEKKAKKAKPKVKEPEPEVEKESVVEEKAEIKKEPVEPEAGNEPDKLDKAEDGEDRSGKLKLEGEIQVDDSGGMSFSFPSEKKNLVRKDVHVNGEIKFAGSYTGSIKFNRFILHVDNQGDLISIFAPDSVLEDIIPAGSVTINSGGNTYILNPYPVIVGAKGD